MSRYDILKGLKPKRPRKSRKPVLTQKKEIPTITENIIGRVRNSRIPAETQEEIIQNQERQENNRIPAELRERIIRDYLQTEHGRSALATSMAEPLRQRLNLHSFARRIFVADNVIPVNAQLLYDKPSDDSAYFIQENNIVAQRNGTRVLVPEFEIASNTQIPSRGLTHYSQAFERINGLIFNEIRSEEEDRCSSLLDGIISNQPERNLSVSLSMSSFMDAFGLIESNLLRVSMILMNPVDYNIFRPLARGQIDQVNDPAIRQTGLMSSLWGASIIISRRIPVGRIYFTSEPEFTGVMPIREELSIISVETMEYFGWSARERLGMCCHNIIGIAAITTENFQRVGPIKKSKSIKLKNRYQILKGL
jgi:hypothetical protein